jgi:hypothetical protein
MAGEVEYVEPEFRDWDPLHSMTAEKLRMLARQKASVQTDIADPTTPIGQAVRAAAGSAIGIQDNGDGTLTLTSESSYVDNGDGTLTIGA